MTARPPRRAVCTDCGISRTADPGRCGRACQFIRPDYPEMERRAHGRARDPERGDERHFGPYRRMARARLARPARGAQWTGIATRLAERLLETGAVDGVITTRPDEDDRWRPVPILVERAEDLAGCRGMRMGYAPLLSLLEPARARGLTRLAVIGLPCHVYALRALERELGFERLYVIGTPCSDNTDTARFHEFLARLSDAPETITYLEFMPDYAVELRHDDGRVRRIPFIELPISDLPADFFPLACRTCVDYANSLADVTVGYMAADGDQWLIVRNVRGEEILAAAEGELRLRPLSARGRRRGAVAGFVAAVERAAGGLPTRRAPRWLRPVLARLMPLTGPRGLEFARARLEMKAAETILHLRRSRPAWMRRMIPAHVWELARPYGLSPRAGERDASEPARPPASLE